MSAPGAFGTAAWAAVEAQYEQLASVEIRDLFAQDPDRGRRLAVTAGDLYLNLAKHRVTDGALAALVGLAEAAGVPARIEAMLRGEAINTTEQRSVLHPALRMPAGRSLVVDGVDVVAQVHEVLGRMEAFARQVRSGAWTGATGRRIETIVNLGIGGSDLGPAMAYEALLPRADPALTCRFVSNVDGNDLAHALAGLDPATTLFVVVSKTFTTVETLTNASSARDWLTAALGEAAVEQHFVAVSTNLDGVERFGIRRDATFGFWDWVGGRFSVDSAVGLSLLCAVGPEAFEELLAGFRTMDEHFATAPLGANAPVLLAVLGVWYRNLFGAQSHAVIPYDRFLERFPAYLQQLEMESNGKRVRLDGSPVPTDTAPVVWGTTGTNGQHAYFQLLHQGTSLVPVDLLAFARPALEVPGHHRLLLANVVAQAEALAFGRPAQEVAAAGVDAPLVPHRTFPGNRPSTTIVAPALTPSVLGQLIALYEHKVFVQGTIWGINSFDQWGVELGKDLARSLVDEIDGPADVPLAGHDSSTAAIVGHLRRLRGA